MTTQNFTEDELKAALKRRLVSGEITQDQARSAVETWRSQQQPAAPAQPDNRTTSPFELVGAQLKTVGSVPLGAAEVVGTVGSSAIAEPVAGLTGIGAMGLGKFFGVDDPVAMGVKAIEGTREALTYQPRTQAGQTGMKAVGVALTPLGKAIEKSSELAGEAGYTLGKLTGSDQAAAITGAAGATLPEAMLELLGVKGTKATKAKAMREQVEAGNVEALMTPEVQAEMVRQGFTPDEIARIVDLEPEQIERIQRFQELGIEPTLGDITQDTAQRRAEQQLMETAEGEASREIRSQRLAQSNAIESNLEALIDRDVNDEIMGASIKDALLQRKKMTKQKYRDAYEQLADAQEGVKVPVLIDDFRQIEGLPDAGELRDIQAIKPSLYNQLETVLAEFGLNNNEQLVKSLTDKGIPVEHLNLENFDRLRKRLGTLERADETGSMGRIIGPIRQALDEQVDLATNALENSPNANIASLAKDARRAYKASLEEFAPSRLADDLTKNAPRSQDPAIHASQVYQKIVAPNVPIEKVDDLIQSLKAQGKMGEAAISQLQSNVVLDLMDSAFKGSSNKIDGTTVFSAAAFERQLNKLNKNGKLKLIFQDNPRAYKRLMDVSKTMQDLTPGKLEIVKGSGSTMLDIMNAMGVVRVMNIIPGAGDMAMGTMENMSKTARNRKVLNRLREARPDFKEVTGIMASDYPSLAAVLGIGYIAQQGEEE